MSVVQVSQPVVENTEDFVNSVLDEVDMSDPAAVSSTVSSILATMVTPPASSDDSSVNSQCCI